MIMSTSYCILLVHAHIGDQHIPSLVESIRLVLYDHENITLILFDQAHSGDQHIPSFVDSII
jgi:hypothetical protein